MPISQLRKLKLGYIKFTNRVKSGIVSRPIWLQSSCYFSHYTILFYLIKYNNKRIEKLELKKNMRIILEIFTISKFSHQQSENARDSEAGEIFEEVTGKWIFVVVQVLNCV